MALVKENKLLYLSAGLFLLSCLVFAGAFWISQRPSDPPPPTTPDAASGVAESEPSQELRSFVREVFFIDDKENSVTMGSNDNRKTESIRALNSEGEFHFRAGSSDLVITAPHGRWDRHTDLIVKDLCQLEDKLFANATCVIGKYFRMPRETVRPGRDSQQKQANKLMINRAAGSRSTVLADVNRPTDKSLDDRDQRSNCEFQNPIAHSVFASFWRRIPKNPKLYVEIHGFSSSKPQRLPDIAKSESIAAATIRSALGDFEANVEGELTAAGEVRNLGYTASQAKRCGTLSRLKKFMHIELPGSYRYQKKSRTKTVRDLGLLIDRLYQQCGAAATC